MVAACAATAPVPRLGPLPSAAVGEVGASRAVVWAQCGDARAAEVQVNGAPPVTVAVDRAHDFVAIVPLDGLRPHAPQRYRVRCDGDPAREVHGAFRTAPDPAAAAPVRIAWGGDLGGQNVCRDAAAGYDVFAQILRRRPDAFVALGDMIYADNACGRVGLYGNRQLPGPPPAGVDAESFRAHWRYNRADPVFARFLLATPYYAVWDDHEIHDDAGPREPVPDGAARFAAAREAFRDYQPIPRERPLHRAARWGRHLELFVLDTRSDRDPGHAPDDAAAPKSTLGAEQRAWLVRSLAASDATWKVVVSSVSLAIPTGEGWADAAGGGFERELLEILAAARAARVRNLVWITTDVHFATGFRHRAFADLGLVEIVSGPLNAGLASKAAVDPTLDPERLFFHAAPAGLAGFAQARGFMTFGELDVAADGTLTVRMVNADGAVVFARDFAPAAS